jgi:hypothetical protein
MLKYNDGDSGATTSSYCRLRVYKTCQNPKKNMKISRNYRKNAKI